MSSKEQWGNATWYLFHSMAYKLKSDRIDMIKPLINIIKIICSNLPCPDCTMHATNTLKSLKERNIRTKEDLVNMLWSFHNRVNVRTNKPIFNIDEHNELYNKANLSSIIINFINVMNNHLYNEKAMVHTLARKNALVVVINFLKENENIFEI